MERSACCARTSCCGWSTCGIHGDVHCSSSSPTAGPPEPGAAARCPTPTPPPGGGAPRPGVAIGDMVLDLAAAHAASLFSGEAAQAANVRLILDGAMGQPAVLVIPMMMVVDGPGSPEA